MYCGVRLHCVIEEFMARLSTETSHLLHTVEEMDSMQA